MKTLNVVVLIVFFMAVGVSFQFREFVQQNSNVPYFPEMGERFLTGLINVVFIIVPLIIAVVWIIVGVILRKNKNE